MAWLKAKSDVKFDVQIEIQCAIGEDPAICYERYVLGELDLDELRSNNRSFDKPLRIKMDIIRKKLLLWVMLLKIRRYFRR